MKSTPAGPAYYGAVALLCATNLVVLCQLLRPAERARRPAPAPSALFVQSLETSRAEPRHLEAAPHSLDSLVELLSPETPRQPGAAPAVRVVGLAPAPREKE